ncbi:DNA-binding transcriptional regulator, GntR family [Tistlia consotensis]|uniref:DNA-binding transcriptional regulator, GntR family n=1 Tax=Tistlia consotensis USBA 355 TaxID=560819 RepID=A0A1Y6CQG9_9PROT|nr:GntR family transcriptional regulator [Tistlia consotensis]SMF71036.1 DNA-binding transcriptional regulator, GntR family [Tistlia consotensis USBA 355]SNS06850.1 DNA-binding transcriptional regulator, GntR family [Tistlia consotensis]
MSENIVGPGARSPHAGGGTLRHHAYESLKGMILSSAFHPGERLSEVRLSQMIGVSRTPLREALMLLEAEGLVIGRPNSGYCVVHFDPEAIRALLVAREGLDGYVAEVACRTATDEDLARVTAVMAEIDELDRRRDGRTLETARELELGLRIHEVIAAATRNPALQDMTRRLYERLRVALWLEVLLLDSWDDAVRQHRAIVEAVVARDVPRAVEAARAHVRDSLSNMAGVERLYRERRQRFKLPLRPPERAKP